MLLRAMILPAAALLAACADDGFGDAERAAIEAASKEWLAAHTAKDWDALLAMYTDDAVFIPPDSGPVVTGKDAIRAWFIANESDARVELDNLEIVGNGDLAYVRGKSRVIVPSASGPPTILHGDYLDIRRRTADGRWLVARDMVRVYPPP